MKTETMMARLAFEPSVRPLPGRRVAHFSCGAASAVATKLAAPDVIWYAATGSEDNDNARFMADCQAWFKMPVQVLSNPDYADTWAVWESRQYIAGIKGAPCTGLLKVAPRVAAQRPGDVHIFGYTADGPDIRRAEALRENWPDLIVETPLIDRGINKAACLALLETAGIAPREPMRWVSRTLTASLAVRPRVPLIGRWYGPTTRRSSSAWRSYQDALESP